ncbi:MAG TPA: dihydropyrimidinase [Aggregatilineales bacterium]|nr:dihydropyrimidinase [Aggregatilineales bacterium]
MPRTLITGGIIINATASYRADVLIDGEQIVGIVRDATLIPGDRIIDATDCYVLPGLIDAHTHIQLDTGIYRTADNWEIGTQVAAWGGVTTVIDFATQFRGQTFEEAVHNRQAEASKSVIDYGLHCMITALPYGEERQLQSLLDLGIVSYKLFTTYRPNYYLDDATILRIMTGAAKYGGVVMVHCENDSIIAEMTDALISQGKTGLPYHGRSRPVLAEEEAVNRILYLAEAARCAVYIVHCSSANSVLQVRQALQRSVQAYCETCPQYLLLDESQYLGDTPECYILQPPLRAKEQNAALWKLVSGGAIDVISTDHCDYSLAQKRQFADFTRTPGGLPGLETLWPLLYTHSVDKARLPLTGLVRMLCTNPARIFGLEHRKGDIRAGLDADIVIYDPQPRTHVQANDLHGMAGYSPYEGHRLRGAVRTVICRGQMVIENREFVGTPGYGQFVPGKL